MVCLWQFHLLTEKENLLLADKFPLMKLNMILLVLEFTQLSDFTALCGSLLHSRCSCFTLCSDMVINYLKSKTPSPIPASGVIKGSLNEWRNQYMNNYQHLSRARCVPGTGLSASCGLACLLDPHNDPLWLHECLIMVGFKLCVWLSLLEGIQS